LHTPLHFQVEGLGHAPAFQQSLLAAAAAAAAAALYSAPFTCLTGTSSRNGEKEVASQMKSPSLSMK
jgi:hypothetical protein